MVEEDHSLMEAEKKIVRKRLGSQNPLEGHGTNGLTFFH
jgi:hypothetical protein